MKFQNQDIRQCPSANAFKGFASELTGLDNFGDTAREAGLEVYVTSMAEEVWPDMTAKAREVAADYVTHQLANRLRLIADRQAYPQIASQKIAAPLIVVGPPRSGSTLLHTLLSLDPDNMAPEHWVCREPSPPPALGPPDAARLARADARMTGLFGLIPDIFVTHPYMIEEGSGALAECGSDILSLAFTSQQLWCFWGGETYRRYLLEADHTAALSLHHDFLQHVQWGNPARRWALKGSDHMLWLGELAAQYPDVKLIWTHRDLAQQLGSLASVQSILLGLRGHPVTPDERRAQGRRAIELQHASIVKAMRAREGIGDDRFLDVSYHDVMNDHLRTVERIYDWAGLSVSDLHADRIRQWIKNHPPTKHGAHRHSPEEFGMHADGINAQFAAYRDKFGFGFGVRPELLAH